MSKFTEENFKRIIQEIEISEKDDENNIWLPIGILEVMYDDDMGCIDKYFWSPKETRDINKLWESVR